MKKYLVLGACFLLNGCSYFTINSTMCEQVAGEPNVVMSQECKDYSEKDAEKAFNKVRDDKKVSDKDIKFDTDEEK